MEYLDRNAAQIRERIRLAAERAGRKESDVLLLAAVKYADIEEIRYLYEKLGICELGENRVQQLLEHYEKIDPARVRLHFIGSLQTNKVKYIIDKVCMIHSLDSLHLAAEIDRQAQKHGRVMDVLVEINSGRGFVGSIMYYIGVALRWVTNTIGFGSYIVGLLYFAIVIELLMLPFSIKQQKNSIRQAKLRPKEMAIRNKYKGRNDDVTRRKIQEETQALYQKENFNPLSGCLPLLLQLPIIYVLYYVVIDPLQYMLGGSSNLSSVLSSFYTTAKAAGGYGGTLQSSRGTIEVLSQLDVSNLGGLKDFLYFNPQTCADASETLGKICKDVPNFSVGGLNFGMTPSFTNPSLLLIVPVLTFAVYFLSMKITRKMSYQPIGNDDPGMGCSGKMMDYTMPLMSVWISFIVPAVVGIYWIFKSIVGTVKTVILSKVMPLPKFTEEDYKAAERALAGKAPAKREDGGSTRSDGDRPRSLHHIDDDDDLPPTGARERRKEPYREEDEETGETAGEASKEELTADDKRAKDMIEGATLKDDGADAEKNGKKEKKKKNQ